MYRGSASVVHGPATMTPQQRVESTANSECVTLFILDANTGEGHHISQACRTGASPPGP